MSLSTIKLAILAALSLIDDMLKRPDMLCAEDVNEVKEALHEALDEIDADQPN